MAPLGRGLFHEHAPLDQQLKGTPNERHLRMMQFIMLHGCVGSPILFARENQLNGMSFDAFKDSIKRLWRMRQTVGELEGYVYRPRQQRRTENANYNGYVYDLTEKGVNLLKKKGLWVPSMRPRSTRSADKWPHGFMIASITASIHIMCEKYGYTYIPPHVFLGEKRQRIEDVEFSFDGVTRKKNLTPDAVFCIDYGPTDTKKHRYHAFALEADRDSEPYDCKDWKRKSFKSSILQYQTFMKLYRKEYGRNAPMKVLFITVNEPAMNHVLRLVGGYIGECHYICVGKIDGFDEEAKPPKVLSHLFEEPLLRAGQEEWTIRKTA